MKIRHYLWQSVKEVLVIAAIVLIVSPASAQSQQNHIVKRGETFASIASKYGITESELLSANPNAKNCYAGMKLTIVKKAPVVNNSVSPMRSTTTTTAQTSSSSQGNENAASIYLSLGKSMINKNKYRKASKYLNNVLSYSWSTSQQKEEARKLLGEIEDAREERRERWSASLDNLSNSLKKTSQSLMAIGSAAYQMDAVQRGTYAPSRVQVPNYGNSQSTAYNSSQAITNMNDYTNSVIKASEKRMDEINKKMAESEKISKERQETYNRGLAYYNAGKYTEAFNLLKPLAETGYIDAQYKIGEMYAEGKGVQKSEAIAARWFKQAEEEERYRHELLIQANESVRQSMPSSTSSSANTQTVEKPKMDCSACHGTGKCNYCAGIGHRQYDDGRWYGCDDCHQTGKCRYCFGSGHYR